ncbi:MAG: protein disulfide isomerase family protein [Paludisphaera borealis]|uniref:thioredoxin family protein n=1 Tax=Paludisphaera borealis TaxID=1387353 RepID=UPI00283EDC01|nr:protein disulfide isomerase family protein [Paludisphaera borealis]MDR3620979.1 protein disulfide isomerase family protein [Paludisphaera borealis]
MVVAGGCDPGTRALGPDRPHKGRLQERARRIRSETMAIRAISADEFESFLRESEYAVVLFDASWNAASKEEFRPRFEAASETYADRVVFGEIDCDDSVEIARSVPIVNLPTVAYYRRGGLIAALVGYQNVTSLAQALIEGKPIRREIEFPITSNLGRFLGALIRRS